MQKKILYLLFNYFCFIYKIRRFLFLSMFLSMSIEQMSLHFKNPQYLAERNKHTVNIY